MEYGILSLLPPFIAIVLALLTKQVIVSLLAGILIGNIILLDGSIFPAIQGTLDSIVNVFSEGWTTKTILFSFLVGSVITLIQASGGVEGFVHYLTEKNNAIKSRKAAMLLEYFIGIVIFIESSITCLVAGTVARPIADKFKVSREKQAFIADSTSAPVCALMPLNSWGATIMGAIGAQISVGVISGNPVEYLIKSIPYNVYSIVALITTLFFILSGKDFGPMRKAEERAINEGKLIRDGATPMISDEAIEVKTKSGVKPRMINMLLPLLVLILMMPISLYITGDGNMLNGSGSTAVFWSVSACLAFSAIFYISTGVMNLDEFVKYVYQGASAMIPVASILIFAFAIGNVIGTLGTGVYLASLVEGKLLGALGPAVIFILAAVIAFSTGTSFGTFTLMIPIALQMGVAIDANLFACIGAVVSGGVMGDHCSPISDTTIVSSMATASDHIDHVKTQLPYALFNGAISLVLFIIIGFIF